MHISLPKEFNFNFPARIPVGPSHMESFPKGVQMSGVKSSHHQNLENTNIFKVKNDTSGDGDGAKRLRLYIALRSNVMKQ